MQRISNIRITADNDGKMSVRLEGHCSIAETLLGCAKLQIKLLTGQYKQETIGGQIQPRKIDDEIDKR